MKQVGRARIAVWEGGGLWFIEAVEGPGEVPLHAHHAIQVAFLLDGAMKIGAPDTELGQPIVAVDADAAHRLTLNGSAALLFIDPESADGRAMKTALLRERSIAPIEPGRFEDAVEALRSAWRDRTPTGDFRPLGQRLTEALTGETRATPTDARIASIIAGLVDRLDHPLSLSEAARGIYLSPSRLRHLFVEQTGLPFKSYLLWRRLMKAVEVFSAGATLTDAAHAAGFADSAHFSRTCRRMFGLPASALEYV